MNRNVLFSLPLIALSGCQDPTTPIAAPSSDELSRISGPVLVDARDGHRYPTVVVGRQVWMASDLALEKSQGRRALCPSGDSLECSLHGRLYDWAMAMDADSTTNGLCDVFLDRRGICPTGWHLPDSAEWDTLAMANGGMDKAGRILKSTSGWIERMDGSSGAGTDDLGFTGLPRGYYSRGDQGYGLYGHTDPDSSFLERGQRAAWWSRSYGTNYSCNSAWGAFLSWQNDGVRNTTVPRVSGLAIRCVRDKDTLLP